MLFHQENITTFSLTHFSEIRTMFAIIKELSLKKVYVVVILINIYNKQSHMYLFNPTETDLINNTEQINQGIH